MGVVINPLKLLWSFYGRIGRGAYAGGMVLILLLLAAVIAALAYFFGSGRPAGNPPDLLVMLLPFLFFLVFWSQLALTAKRFHDVGKTGWYCILIFVPLVGFIALIFLLVAPGNEHDNQYGPGARSAGQAVS
jgi:uncharacterized membrane protein YhaH (DUF805 family)